MGGLSIATNVLANTVDAISQKNRNALQSTTQRLSSGLRIESAADDPSGLAIAEKLTAQIGGYDAAVGDIQDAANATAIADGALQTTTDILQRIRSLAVEGASDITSNGDRANLQAEVASLLAEVDRISQNTQYNGTPLLDGSRSGPTPQQPAQIVVASNAVTSSQNAVVPIADPNFESAVVPGPSNWLENPASYGFTGWNYGPADIVYTGIGTDGDMPYSYPSVRLPPGVQGAALADIGATLTQNVTVGAAGTYVLSFQSGYGNPPIGDVTLGVTVNGAVVGAITPTTTLTSYSVSLGSLAAGPATIGFVYQGTSNAPNIGVTGVSLTSTNAFVPSTTTSLLIATAVAADTNFATTLGASPTRDGTIELQVINTGASIATQERFIDSATGAISVSPVLYAPEATFTAFDNVAVTLGPFGSADVGASGYIKIFQNVPAASNAGASALSVHSGANEGDVLQIGLPAVNTAALRIANINLLVSSANDPSLGAEDAIGQIDGALTRLLAERASLGALGVRLDEDVDDDDVAATNLQASESAIRDANVGTESTSYTREQILAQTDTAILAQANANPQTALLLFR